MARYKVYERSLLQSFKGAQSSMPPYFETNSLKEANATAIDILEFGLNAFVLDTETGLCTDAVDITLDKPQAVKDWYVQAFPSDDLGGLIDPSLSFDDAMRAVAQGGGFYDVIGVGDSVVRERIFHELSARSGIDYSEIYDAWIENRPVPGTGLLEPVYGPEIYEAVGQRELAGSGEGSHGDVSLKSVASSSLAAADRLAETASETPDQGPVTDKASR